jgi:hypothetical protein
MQVATIVPLTISVMSVLLPLTALIYRSASALAWTRTFAHHLMHMCRAGRILYGWLWLISVSHLLLLWTTHARAFLVAICVSVLIEQMLPSVLTIAVFFVSYTACVYVQEIHVIDAKIASSSWLRQDKFFFYQIDSFLRVSNQRHALTYTWVLGMAIWFAKVLWILWLSSFD